MAAKKFAPTIYDAWITKVMELNPGEQLFIPVEDKVEQTLIYDIMNKALEKGPQSLRTEVRVSKTFRDKRLWVQLTRRTADHSTAFVKFRKPDGSWDIRKEEINTSMGRLRMIQVMVEDGLDQPQIEDQIGELSEGEELLFFKGGM